MRASASSFLSTAASADCTTWSAVRRTSAASGSSHAAAIPSAMSRSFSSVEASFQPFQIVHPNGRTVRKPRGTSPRYHDAVGTPAETKRFRVRVSGPLPGRPSEEGEFVMTVRRYGDRPGWWINPDQVRQ